MEREQKKKKCKKSNRAKGKQKSILSRLTPPSWRYPSSWKGGSEVMDEKGERRKGKKKKKKTAGKRKRRKEKEKKSNHEIETGIND
jgi:hypothetical protein